ncbi:hypothetical protein KJ652_00245 [Patescibacteria group bacterium]|nr:hypothetical protein [Patescibacteria group bacterium]MBU1123003.1 hypothetical protein [Patescibacteria group bacterium]MBU1911157.1 hypothetical protein [Patescibacteria group bacterium]
MAKSPNIGTVQAMSWLVCVLMFLAMLAALAGIYETHFVGAGATFGTTGASLSIIAFAITSHLWVRSLSCCMGCCEK